MPNLEDVEAFAGRLQSDGAEVIYCTNETLSQTVIGLIATREWDRVVSVRRNRVGHPSVLGDDPPLSNEALASIDAVITESSLGVADEGVIVLDHGPGQGRPGLTLAPGTHLCVVTADSIVGTAADLNGDDAMPGTVVGGPNADDTLRGGVIHRAKTLIVVIVV